MSLANGLIGRKAVLKKGSTIIAALRTKTVSLTNDGVDVTSDDDVGWRRFLEADPAERSAEITADGILKSNAILDDIISDTSGSATYTLEFGSVTERLSGTFRLSNVEIGASYNDAITFSLTLQSSGAITHAAP